MKVTLNLSDELVAWIQARGQEPQSYVQTLIEDDIRTCAVVQKRVLEGEDFAREPTSEP